MTSYGQRGLGTLHSPCWSGHATQPVLCPSAFLWVAGVAVLVNVVEASICNTVGSMIARCKPVAGVQRTDVSEAMTGRTSARILAPSAPSWFLDRLGRKAHKTTQRRDASASKTSQRIQKQGAQGTVLTQNLHELAQQENHSLDGGKLVKARQNIAQCLDLRRPPLQVAQVHRLHRRCNRLEEILVEISHHTDV